ncbi:MAG TPA: S8 family peptidase, partial [Opitutaceae bacterium]
MPALRLLRRVILLIPVLLASAYAADDLTEKEIRQGHRARTLLAKPRAGLAQVERAEAVERVQLVRSHPALGGLRTLETDGAEEIGDVIKRLRDTGLYEYVEPDYIRTASVLPNDPRLAEDQWSLDNTGQAGGTPGAHIGAAAAWDIQREAPNVLVAVIDSGLLVTHEDIAANLWENTAERQGTPFRDDDGNGYIDDLHGIDATVARTSTVAGQPRDVVGHGTHVAGIIGAVGDNAKGIAGVAWKTQIIALKFLGRFGGSVSGSIACIDYAIARKVHVINASYGSHGYSQAEYDALKRARDAGIIVVAAAGNDNQEISDFPSYPAAYELDNIIAVAATTRQDKLASFSTYGSGLVELAAPGASILSLGITA